MKLAPPAPAPEVHGSPLRATALVAFGIFLLGTLLYTLCVPVWSGRSVAAFAVPVASGGSAVLGPMHLDPDMKPVRVLVRVAYRPPPSPDATCTATLRDANGRVVWSERRDFFSYAVGHPTRSDRGTALVIETFDPKVPGQYTIEVAFDPRSARVIHDAWLEVRGQVASVQAWFVITGAVLALMSLAVVVLAAPLAARAAAEHSHAA